MALEPRQLRPLTRGKVLRNRRAQAKKSADVFVQPGADGMATLGAQLSADEAAEAYAQLDELARMAKADGDLRPIAAIGTELVSLLLRRPGGHGQPGVAAHPSITAALDSLAGGSARAGTVNGLPITAGHARELLARIGTLGLTDAAGRLLATTTVAELLRVATKGCAEHPGQDCGCPVLGAPADTDTYRPTDRQQTFIRTRDRTCRMPGCGQRAAGPTWTTSSHGCGGGTSCTNLCCLCRTDHHPHHPATGPAPTPTRTTAGRTGRRATPVLASPWTRSIPGGRR